MSRVKKICFIVSEPANSVWFLKTPITKLRENYEVHLVANFSNTKPQSYIEFTDYNHSLPIRRKINLIQDLSCLLQAIIFFRKNKFDSIHSITPKAGLISMLAGFIARVPIRVHTFTGQVWATKKGVFKYLLKAIDRIINYFATAIIVDGKAQREFLITQKIIYKDSIVFGEGSICGVDTERFKSSRVIRNNLREKYEIPENEWVFMFLGRITKEKGVEDLITVFRTIDSPFAKKLILVGPDEEGIIQRNKDTLKKHRILYIPFTEKSEEILQMCDTFCLPSYREGFGLAVIEASAVEKPIICSDAYGLKDTISENITGLRHVKGDLASLRNLLVYALNNKEEMKKMGVNGRAYIVKNFSKEEILMHWVNFYAQLHDTPYKAC